MTVNILIETATVADTLIIPQSAVGTVSGQNKVQVFTNGVVEERTVVTGLKDGNGHIEVVSGLAVGEQVVIAKNK